MLHAHEFSHALHRPGRARLFAALSTLVALSLAAAPLPAQDGSGTSTARPTVVALPDRFPVADAASMLVRTPERDVVVMKASDLSVEGLAMALSLLRRIEATDPTPTRGQIIPITGYALLAYPGDAARQGLEAALLRLERAPSTMLGDLGPGRWVRLGR